MLARPINFGRIHATAWAVALSFVRFSLVCFGGVERCVALASLRLCAFVSLSLSLVLFYHTYHFLDLL